MMLATTNPTPEPDLARYPSCIVCGNAQLSELAGSREMATEARHREQVFRRLSPPGTPTYMLKDRAYPTQTYDARLVLCDTCGTLARDPHLSAEGSAECYAQDAYHPAWLESSYREFLAAFEDRMPELVRWVGPSARVLEIGSFVGGFLAAAQKQGWRAEGVDPGRCVTRFARSKGLKVHEGSFEGTQFPDRTFDAVFVWFCFDQLAQPWEALGEIHRVLKDDGRLLIRVPNGEFVERMQRLERWTSSDGVREGLRNILAYSGLAGFPFQVGYTPSSLRGMLEESGFTSVHVKNRINVRGSDSAALRLVHMGSQILDHATFGAVKWGPWIEVSCRKPGYAVAGNELLTCCVA
jgi:SAM-dependent methyltransferase